MDILASFLNQIKVPSANDNIYSEECVFSFDTPVKLANYFHKNFANLKKKLFHEIFRKVILDCTSAWLLSLDLERITLSATIRKQITPFSFTFSA